MSERNAGRGRAALIVIVTLLCRSRLHAAGFAIQEQSGRGLGTAFVGEAAIAQDASTAYFNAAGLTRLPGTWATVSGTMIQFDADFRNDRSYVNPAVGGGLLQGDGTQNAGGYAVIPAGYVSQQLNDRWTIGIALNSPFGLRTSYDRDWVGRYDAMLSDLKTFDLAPTFAVKLGHGFSVGGGLDVQYARAQLSNMLDLGTLCAENASAAICDAIGLAPQSTDGFVRIKGDSVGFGGNVGVLWEPTEKTRFGVSWRSRIDHTLEGVAHFSIPAKATILRQQSGALKNTGGHADLNLPDVVRIGFFHRFGERWAVMGGADWTHWSRFQDLVFEFDNPKQPTIVQPQHWRDTWRGGLAVAFNPTSRWTLRLGSAYDQSPVPNAKLRNPRIPDSDRVWLTGGIGYQATDALRVDLGYAHLFAPGTTRINNPDPVGGDVVRGTYDGSANIVGLQVSLQLN